MTQTCTTCVRTESQAIADARALGLQQEFESGIYTCCQIVAWADEQVLAWFQATHEDRWAKHDLTELASEAETVLVPLRRGLQVPGSETLTSSAGSEEDYRVW